VAALTRLAGAVVRLEPADGGRAGVEGRLEKAALRVIRYRDEDSWRASGHAAKAWHPSPLVLLRSTPYDAKVTPARGIFATWQLGPQRRGP